MIDICFSGIERGGIVAISTMGCCRDVNVFLDGYNEMRKRLKPQLVIVFGNLISTMTGNILNYQYDEAFSGHLKRCQDV